MKRVVRRAVPFLALLAFAGCTEPGSSAIYDLTGTFVSSRETTVGCCPSVSVDSSEIFSPVEGVLRLTLDHGTIVAATLDDIACGLCNGETTATMVSPPETIHDSVELRVARDPQIGNPRFTLLGSFSPDEFSGRISWEYHDSGSRIRSGTFAAHRR